VLDLPRPAHDAQVYRGDTWSRSPLYRECGGPWQIQHYLCAPIVVGGDVVGTFNLGRRSALHPFSRDDAARASRLCARIAARLQALAPEAEPDLGRLSAERTLLRLRARELERDARLPDDEAAALWDAMIDRRIAPLDTFDHGDRTYIVLPVPEADRATPLTPREHEVVALAAAGLANKQIAFELGIATNTVGAMLASASKKLGASSRVKLVEAARRYGENDRAASSPRERTPSLRKIVAT
jgi:DNA-binding CsgD family transcriptional regulator